MTANTLRLVGLGELEQDDVLYWLKATLARDLAAMRAPKSEEERVETLRYAMRRLGEGMERVMRALDGDAPCRVCCSMTLGDPAGRYYGENGDPPWGPMPNWAAS